MLFLLEIGAVGFLKDGRWGLLISKATIHEILTWLSLHFLNFRGSGSFLVKSRVLIGATPISLSFSSIIGILFAFYYTLVKLMVRFS